MDFLNNQSEFLYFVYGLAFFTLGVSAFQQSMRRDSNFQLLKSLKYLGWFGILQGISEWIAMLILASGITYCTDRYIVWLEMFFNSASFVYLLVFGLSLMGITKVRGIGIRYFPFILFSIWIVGFLALEFTLKSSLSMSWCKAYCTSNRYLIGFPGGMISGLALMRNAKDMDEINLSNIAKKFRVLGSLFISLAIASGLIVSKGKFFPANLINAASFESIFIIPIELIRAILAILITIIFVRIVNIFTWEMDEKLTRLLNQQIGEQERRKLGRELHDVTIQKLFSMGIMVENLQEDVHDEHSKQELNKIKDNLNGIISDIRNFISLGYKQRMEIEDLNSSIRDLISQFSQGSSLEIKLNYHIPAISLGQLSSEKWTQIYFIVQEGLSNIVKHSQATMATVTLKSNLNEITIEISDNGIGFNPNDNKPRSYGLVTMRERAAIANGILKIQSCSTGTKIIVSIPWEVYDSEYGAN